MKILLVLPAAEHLRVTSATPSVPRRAMLRFSILPLTTVAALTPPEHDVVLCDENVQALDLDVDVDLVGVSFMTAVAPRAYEIARAFRERGKTVVGGGYHPTLCPADAAPHFDALVLGDAEGAWPRLLADAASGQLRAVYQNAEPCDLVETPEPRRDLMAATARHYVTTDAVQASRGCRHGCRYCSIAAFHGSTHRSRPVERVVAELEGIGRNFIFVDDNIIGDRERARELFEAMAPLRKRWVSQSSIEIADDPELLRLAWRAGCRGLFVGIESVSQANLDRLDKGFNDSRRYRERIRAIRRQGIGVVASMIVGLDGDDVTVFERTLAFLRRIRADALQLNILTPLPGTPLYERMEGEGRVLDHDWGHYDFRHAVIQPAAMSPSQLQAGADWLYREFYRLDRVLVRFVRGFWTLGGLPSILSLRLNLTYRYDNLRERIIGRNPAREGGRGAFRHLVLRMLKGLGVGSDERPEGSDPSVV
ncbi:B12-binding domain-containing radical SAM protein [bacterium]|nr:B12-binding domain-containing radical SAM protein [bacterium]